MTIQWNKVTWYSKLAAVFVFILTFVIAFDLGILFERSQIESALMLAAPVDAAAEAGGAGAHCGGFIRNAPTCAAGYHCQLKINNPDTGGVCVAD
jgi:hypothetical protein